MYGFDNFINDNGFKPYVYCTDKKRFLVGEEKSYKTYPSTMGVIGLTFIREGSDLQKAVENKKYIQGADYWKDNYINYGLSEQGLPPTLIHPRPRIVRKTKVKINGVKYNHREELSMQDKYVNRLLKEIPHSEILEQLFLQDKTYYFD